MLKMVRNKKQCMGQAGFTLIEMLIATAVFATSMTSIVGMYCKALKTNKLAAEYTQFAARGAEHVESVAFLRYDNSGLTDKTVQIDNYTTKTIAQTILQEIPIPGMKSVVVDVNWRDQSVEGGWRNYSLIYAKPEM